MKEVKTIKELYEDGLEIVEANDLYGVLKKIPKHKEASFGEMVKQNFNPKIYEQWWLDAKNIFSSNSLNYLRLKRKVFRNDSSDKYGVGHAAQLHTALKELELIISSQDYHDSYKLSAKKVQQWPEINYGKGLVTQGDDRSHKFSDPEAIKMIDALWGKRKIESPDKRILRPGQPQNWSKFRKSADGNKATAQAINKSMRQKDITLRVKYPKGVKGLLLVCVEKRTNQI